MTFYLQKLGLCPIKCEIHKDVFLKVSTSVIYILFAISTSAYFDSLYGILGILEVNLCDDPKDPLLTKFHVRFMDDVCTS